MKNMGKKLSLEEARALFSDDSEPKKRKRQRKSKKRSYKSSSRNQSHLKNRIKHLERRIMEGDLSKQEEEQILQEIGKLERRID
jgi:uncharacterized coiled-coil DUF342 family protein